MYNRDCHNTFKMLEIEKKLVFIKITCLKGKRDTAPFFPVVIVNGAA